MNTRPEPREPGVIYTHPEPWPDWRHAEPDMLRSLLDSPGERGVCSTSRTTASGTTAGVRAAAPHRHWRQRHACWRRFRRWCRCMGTGISLVSRRTSATRCFRCGRPTSSTTAWIWPTTSTGSSVAWARRNPVGAKGERRVLARSSLSRTLSGRLVCPEHPRARACAWRAKRHRRFQRGGPSYRPGRMRTSAATRTAANYW